MLNILMIYALHMSSLCRLKYSVLSSRPLFITELFFSASASLTCLPTSIVKKKNK
jgi:hypothetical protein